MFIIFFRAEKALEIRKKNEYLVDRITDCVMRVPATTPYRIKTLTLANDRF